MSDNTAENITPEITETAAEASNEAAEASNESATLEASEGAIEASDDAPETQAELEEALEEAAENGASNEELRNMVKEFQLKVNGRTLSKTIDLSDEESVKNELQLAAAGRQAMQEIAELKKIYNQEITRLKEDPYAVLSELGLDPDELAEARIQQRIEEMKKSPEQIEQEKLRAELEAARKREKELEDRAKQAEMQRLQEQAAIQLDDEISNALESHQDLPQSANTVKRIADVMLWAMDNGWDDVTVEDVIPTVKNEIRNELNSFMSDLPEEFLEQYIGKNAIEKLRKKRIQAAKQVESANNVKKTASSEKTSVPREKIKIDDWMRS